MAIYYIANIKIQNEDREYLVYKNMVVFSLVERIIEKLYNMCSLTETAAALLPSQRRSDLEFSQ